jgi:hypothetical protein
MHLLLGHAEDPCCAGVLARLESRGLPARIVPAPLATPARLTWRLDAAGLQSSLRPGVPDHAIAGVLVREAGWLEPDGWEPADHAYMQAELRAVVLAWLAGLSCPVVNRPDAALWYRPQPPLLAWRAPPRSCGLRPPEIVITRDPGEGPAFRGRLAADGVAGAVCTPLTGAATCLLADDEAWERLAALQARTPVCLAEPHGAAMLACIVGSTVFWDRPPAPDAAAHEPALLRFASAMRLAFVAIALAPVRIGLAVVLVEPSPRLERFAPAPRERILDARAALLGRGAAAGPAAPGPAS